MLPSLSELSTAVFPPKTHRKDAEGGARDELLDLLDAYSDVVRAIIDQDVCNVSQMLSSTAHQYRDIVTRDFLLDESFWRLLTGAWRRNAPWTCIMDEAPDHSVAREFAQLMSQAKENPLHRPEPKDVGMIVQNGIQYVASRFAGEALPAPGEDGPNGEPPPRTSEFWTEDFAQSHDPLDLVSGTGEGRMPPYPLRWTDGPDHSRMVWARSLEPSETHQVPFVAVYYNGTEQATLEDTYHVTEGPAPPVLGGTEQNPENNADEDPTGPLLRKYKELLNEYQKAQRELTGGNRAADLATLKQTMESWKRALISERTWLLALFCDGIRKRQAIMVALCVVVDQIEDFDGSGNMDEPPWFSLLEMVHTKVRNQLLQLRYGSWEELGYMFPDSMEDPEFFSSNDIPWGWVDIDGDLLISALASHQPAAYALDTAAKRFAARHGIDEKFEVGMRFNELEQREKKHERQYKKAAALLNAVFEEKKVMQMHELWYG